MTEEWAEAFHGRQGDEKMSVPKARGNKDEGRVNMRVSSMEYRVSGVAPRATLAAAAGRPKVGAWLRRALLSRHLPLRQSLAA